MGFLKRFFKNVFREGAPHTGVSSFENLTDEQLETHMKVSRFGDFELTDAVRPSYDLQVVPETGYRYDAYEDKESGTKIPVIMVSASRELLVDLFFDLLAPLGDEVDVVLETSHDKSRRGHDDLYREHIDLPVLKSVLCDFEEMLTNDGCTGVAVLNPGIPLEVQFDEHKLLVIYGHELDEFEEILADHGIPLNPKVRFITEAEHVHSSTDEFQSQFEELRYRLGVED